MNTRNIINYQKLAAIPFDVVVATCKSSSTLHEAAQKLSQHDALKGITLRERTLQYYLKKFHNTTFSDLTKKSSKYAVIDEDEDNNENDDPISQIVFHSMTAKMRSGDLITDDSCAHRDKRQTLEKSTDTDTDTDRDVSTHESISTDTSENINPETEGETNTDTSTSAANIATDTEHHEADILLPLSMWEGDDTAYSGTRSQIESIRQQIIEQSYHEVVNSLLGLFQRPYVNDSDQAENLNLELDEEIRALNPSRATP